MRLFIMLALITLFPVSASAQEIVLHTNCMTLANLDAEEDVNFKPGIDVNGNPIVPADVNEPLQVLEYPLAVPIELDFLRSLNVGVQNGIEVDPEVAYLMLHEDGKIEYNGQDLSENINIQCAEAESDVEQVLDSAVEAETEPAAGEETAKPESTKPESAKEESPKDDIKEVTE